MRRVFDTVIVGSGCTGGWLAKVSTERGLDTLLLEAGPEIDPRTLTREAYTFTGLVSDRPASQAIQSTHPMYQRANAHLFVDDLLYPYSTTRERPFHWIRGRQLGGRSLSWGGVCIRLSDFELRAGTMDSLSGDWPIAYEELAPYYSRVERFLRVRGSMEGLPQLPDGEFLPPADLSPAERCLRQRILQRWPERPIIPIPSVAYDESTDLPAPRFTSIGSTLVAARATGRLTVRSDAVVTHVLMDPANRRARGVRLMDRVTLADDEVWGRTVVLCGSTIETARLLLNSRTPDDPDGLGNASGVLGCFLMDHPSVGFSARGVLPPGRPPVSSRGAYGLIPRFRNLDDERSDYGRGFGILVSAGREGLDERCVMVAYGEMLPSRANRVSLSPDRTDIWGVPIPHIECAWGDNERALLMDARACLAEMADHTELEIDEWFERPPGGMVHEVGTARMGSDPRTSFVNPACQSWEIPNLFVADGSVWPTSAWQNPTLTMMALAVRCGEGVIRFLETGCANPRPR